MPPRATLGSHSLTSEQWRLLRRVGCSDVFCLLGRMDDGLRLAASVGGATVLGPPGPPPRLPDLARPPRPRPRLSGQHQDPGAVRAASPDPRHLPPGRVHRQHHLAPRLPTPRYVPNIAMDTISPHVSGIPDPVSICNKLYIIQVSSHCILDGKISYGQL